MEYFQDEELNNIKLMAVKYFDRESFRKVIVMKNNYIFVEKATRIFKRNGIILPSKYDNDIHEGITNVVTEFVNSREGKENFRRIFLISMRNYDFAIVLFPKKEITDLQYEMYSLGYNLIAYFITANEDDFDECDKREGTVIAGVDPIYFTIDF
jgi:hypothetical protein